MKKEELKKKKEFRMLQISESELSDRYWGGSSYAIHDEHGNYHGEFMMYCISRPDFNQPYGKFYHHIEGQITLDSQSYAARLIHDQNSPQNPKFIVFDGPYKPQSMLDS